jgi:hypothetical protein
MGKLERADKAGVRAQVDLSALYPSDQAKLPSRRQAKSEPRDAGSGKAAERRAMREALAGWRWL